MCLIKPGCFHFASEAPVMKVKNNFQVRQLSLLNIEYRLKPLERPVQIQIFVGCLLPLTIPISIHALSKFMLQLRPQASVAAAAA